MEWKKEFDFLLFPTINREEDWINIEKWKSHRQ